MLRLLELLRNLDSALLSGRESSEVPAGTVWGAVLAVVGGLLVLAAGLALGSHAMVQMPLVAIGMILTVPYLQDVVDKARTPVEE